MIVNCLLLINACYLKGCVRWSRSSGRIYQQMMSEMPLAVSLDSRRRGHLGGQIRLIHVHIRKVTSPEMAEVVATSPLSHQFPLVHTVYKAKSFR
jgi:hypothetical protein